MIYGGLTVIEGTRHNIDWEQVRIQAAIAAMQGYIGGNSVLGMDDDEIAKWAVKQADALIEELKKEK